MEVEVYGFETHPWLSVERTRKFYGKALSRSFRLRPANRISDAGPAVSLNFSGSTGWDFDVHPSRPLVYALHGGTVLDHRFLASRLGKLQRSDGLIVNCRSDVEILKALFDGPGPKVYHLPLPVDSNVYRPGNKRSAREDLKLKTADYVIGFVGRLLPQRNLHRFLDTIAALKRLLKPARVAGLVVGQFWVDYPVLNFGAAEYPKYISERMNALRLGRDICYITSTPADVDLATCYQAMDLLYHPTNSIDENFGYVPVEAMAAGVPVVGYSYGGLKDTVVDGVTGHLASTWVTRNGIRMNTIGIASYCAAVLSDRQKLTRLKRASREHAQRNYSFERCAGILNASLQESRDAYAAAGGTGKCCGKPLPSHVERGELPTAEWNDYSPAVAYYTSSACPVPIPSATVALSAVLKRTSREFVSSDITWPARFRFRARERRMLQCCSSPIRVQRLIERSGCSLEDVAGFLRRGILVTDVTTPQNGFQSGP